MALVTGGLGGLGMLASNELAAAGTKYIVTTSRSGRPSSMRPELLRVMETMQANALHHSVKCDSSDGAAMNDLFAWINRPVQASPESAQMSPLEAQAFRAHLIGLQHKGTKPKVDLEILKQYCPDFVAQMVKTEPTFEERMTQDPPTDMPPSQPPLMDRSTIHEDTTEVVSARIAELKGKLNLTQNSQAEALSRPGGPRWLVTGSKDGISVRRGAGLRSLEYHSRLRMGAIVEEVEVRGDRFCFRKLSGEGPGTGWVSIHQNGLPIMIKQP